MECSERTKRRKISAKVKEHLRLMEKECMMTDLLAQDSEKEYLLDDVLEDSDREGSTDIFYDAHDENCFENSSNDLEDENSSLFYNCDISSFDGLDFENRVADEMPGCDSDCDLNGDECSDLENDADSCGLAEWAAEFNIPQTALSALLKILRRKGLDVPLNARTLMSTDRSCNVTSVAGGSYYHFGIENALVAELTSLGHLANVTDTLTLRINIDGLPLFRSSSVSLWPILGKIKEIPGCSVFVIGMYSGTSKPASVQEYLQEFILDLKAVSQSGIVYNGLHFRVALPDAFICDAPARAFIKCTKGHTWV